MTRINLINPLYLTDQHGLAEIKEINQLCGSFRKSLYSKNGIILEKIPKTFTLNKGHVYFFYNKGLYLHNRFELIVSEMKKRGFNIISKFPVEVWPPEYFQDWEPNCDDEKIIKKRICERLRQKPKYYRYYGNYIDINEFMDKFYIDY